MSPGRYLPLLLIAGLLQAGVTAGAPTPCADSDRPTSGAADDCSLAGASPGGHGSASAPSPHEPRSPDTVHAETLLHRLAPTGARPSAGPRAGDAPPPSEPLYLTTLRLRI